MSDVTLTRAVISLNDLTVARMTATHTTAFVSPVGDGTVRVRFTGPRVSGVSSLEVSAPLSSVLVILREASGLVYGDLDGTAQTMSFVPAPGRSAATPEDCHAQGIYSVWMHPTV